MRLFLGLAAAALGAATGHAAISAGAFETVAAINNHWGLRGELPSKAEATVFQKLGVKVIRTGFDWGLVEKTRGVYEWGFYDRLMDELESMGVSALFCVHPQSPAYPGPRIPLDPDAIAAFARFFQALAARYGSRPGYAYAEISNEPNLASNETAKLPQSWSNLAAAAVGAVRGNATSSKARLTGPAIANAKTSASWPLTRWLHQALANHTGLADDLDLVTIHTYRPTAPETVATTFSVGDDVVRAAAKDPLSAAPVAAGEWGYTSCTMGVCYRPVSEEVKALYLAREWLVGHALGRRVAVWYDWHEDCDDPTNRECRFGVVTHAAYEPLPAYDAGRAALSALRGMWAATMDVSPIPGGGLEGDDDDFGQHLATWVVSYTSGGGAEEGGPGAGGPAGAATAARVDAAAVWINADGNSTTAHARANVTVQLDAGRSYAVTDALGRAMPSVTGPSAVIEASGAPVYLRA